MASSDYKHSSVTVTNSSLESKGEREGGKVYRICLCIVHLRI